MADHLSSSVSSEITTLTTVRELLDKLLNEVSVLSIRLRQDARRVQTVGELPTGGHSVLRMLSEFGTLTVPQMARLDSTSRQNIQISVNRLEREGCLESVPNAAHKRSQLMRLTDRGIASLKVVSRNADAYKEKLLSQLSKEDLTQVSKVLRQIREALFATQPSPETALRDRTPWPPTKKPKRTEEPFSEPKPGTHQEPVQVEQTYAEENELPVSLL